MKKWLVVVLLLKTPRDWGTVSICNCDMLSSDTISLPNVPCIHSNNVQSQSNTNCVWILLVVGSVHDKGCVS